MIITSILQMGKLSLWEAHSLACEHRAGVRVSFEPRKDCVIPILMSGYGYQLPLDNEEVSKKIPECSMGFGSFLQRWQGAHSSVGQSWGVCMVESRGRSGRASGWHLVCFSELQGWPRDRQVPTGQDGTWEGCSDGVCPEARWAAGALGCPPV